MGKGSKPRPTQISREELDLRWAFAQGKIQISDEEFKQKVKEIRKRTGKPYTPGQRKALEDIR